MSSDATPASEPRTTGVMHIGEVAARTELSLRSLRHWDDVGLVKPSGRTDGGFRLYTEADVEKILLIRRMKPLGFTLEAMSAAMRDIETLERTAAVPAEKAAAQQRLAGILEEAGERRERLVRHVAMADEFIGVLSQRLA